MLKILSTLGVMVGPVISVVVVYFLPFYFRGKAIINANYPLPIKAPHPSWLTNLEVIFQAHAISQESFKAKVWGPGKKLKNNNHLNANKVNNRFNFLLSPRPKPMID